VAEEMDFVSVSADERQPGGPAFNESAAGSNDVLRSRGFDPEYGRQLLAGLRAAGLADIGTEGRVRLWPGGSAGASAWRLTFEQLQPDMVARGLDPATIAAVIRACQDPGFTFMSQVTMAAWGRVPRPGCYTGPLIRWLARHTAHEGDADAEHGRDAEQTRPGTVPQGFFR
jgi:hypothetical protein